MIEQDYSSVFITDGLSCNDAKTRFQNRRTQFKEALPHPCIISGVHTPLDRGEPWLLTHSPLYQEPTLSYFTGINQTDVLLLLNPFGEDLLFLPEKDEKKEFWEGIRFGSGSEQAEKEAKTLLGFKQIHHRNDFHSVLSNYLNTHDINELYTVWYEKKSRTQAQQHDTTFQFYTTLKRWIKKTAPHIQVKNAISQLWPFRLCLDQTDIQNMRSANQKATQAFTSVCHALPSLTQETEVAGLLSGEIIKQSWLGHSFPSIIAGGKNAAVLHYHANNAPLHPGSLLLMDFGVRDWHMPSDVSRTIPVSGAFNPMQRILYAIVLDTQLTVERAVKEGITIQELNDLCWDTLEQLLDDRFLSIGGTCKRSYDRQPHNVSHLIGLMVHDGDPYRNYRTMPLSSNMVISNEPGLYGTFKLTINGISYEETLGIRIEDDLLVTTSGCQNLTCCPKSIPDIESLFS